MDNENDFNNQYAGPPKSFHFESDLNKGLKGPDSEAFIWPPVSSSQKKDDDSDELLKIISSGDEDERQKGNKQKKATQISFDFQELKFCRQKVRSFVNDNLKKHAKLFLILNLLWGIGKFCFYIAGISFFALCLYYYLALESLINKFLLDKKIDITYDRLEQSLNDIVLVNVKDRNNLFTIGTLKINFSFDGLLDSTFAHLSIDSLRVNVKDKENTATDLQKLLDIFQRLGVLDGKVPFAIKGITLDNSYLVIENEEYQLPIHFTGVGVFDQKKHIRFPVKLMNQYLSIDANLDVDVTVGGTKWTFDITSGKLVNDIWGIQELQGKFVIDMNKSKIKSANLKGALLQGPFKKDLNIDLTLNRNGSFDAKGTVSFVKQGVSAEFTLDNVKIENNLAGFSASGGLFAFLSNIKYDGFSASDISFASKKGDLKCNLSGCSYQLMEPASVSIVNPIYDSMNMNFFVPDSLDFSLDPNGKENFSLKDGFLVMDLFSKSCNLKVVKKQEITQKNLETKLTLKDVSFAGAQDFKKGDWNAVFKSSLQDIKGPIISLSTGNIIGIFKNKEYNWHLVGKDFLLPQNRYFKIPADVVLDVNSDQFFSAKVNAKNWLVLNTTGYFRPYTGEVFLRLKTETPISFVQSSPSPYEISEFISPDIKNVLGQVQLKGDIHYVDSRSVYGPMRILLDDVAFSYGNMRVNGMNSVLNLSHIVPFGTSGMQEIYVRSLQTPVPFDNLSAFVMFDADKKQFNISALDTSVAGYAFRLDPMWFSYHAPLYNFLLKGKIASLQSVVDNLKLRDLTISAMGSAQISAQLEGNDFKVKNFEISVPTEGKIYYRPFRYDDVSLEVLRTLIFRRMSIYFNQIGELFEVLVVADNKQSKVRKQTNLRIPLKNTLESYIIPLSPLSMPASILRAKKDF